MEPRRWHLEDLAIGFGRQTIVSGISCPLTIGDFVVVTGANGSGKTCLLRTLTGELRPRAGAIRAPHGFDHRGLGIVPQVTDLDPRLPISLREMAALGSCGLHDPCTKERLDACLHHLGLSPARAAQTWARSSGGERQRTLIARAMIRRPEVVLMDEPTSHLDERAAHALFAELRQRCDDGRLLVIAVLHDQDLIERYTGKRIHLAQGAATCSGWP